MKPVFCLIINNGVRAINDFVCDLFSPMGWQAVHYPYIILC